MILEEENKLLDPSLSINSHDCALALLSVVPDDSTSIEYIVMFATDFISRKLSCLIYFQFSIKNIFLNLFEMQKQEYPAVGSCPKCLYSWANTNTIQGSHVNSRDPMT